MPTVSIYDAATQVTAATADPDGRVVLATPTGGPDETISPAELKTLLGIAASTGREYNPRDFGAVPGHLPQTAGGKTTALANAAAINECLLQARLDSDSTYITNWGTTQNGVPGLGGSIYRRYMPVVKIDDHYQIAAPLEMPWQTMTSFWHCDGGIISRYGTEASWLADNPGRWAIEVGDDVNENQVPMFLAWQGLCVAGFRYAVRLGLAPANLNMAVWVLDRCHFIGQGTNVPGSIGLRAFNRSAVFSLYNCMWDQFSRDVEVQSVDRFGMEACRIQKSPYLFNSDVPRAANEGAITLHHGRLRLKQQVGNPPLVEAAESAANWTANTLLVEGAYRKIGGIVYRTKRQLTTQSTSGAEDLSSESLDWEVVPAEARGIANIDTQRHFWVWTKEFDPWQPNREYLRGDMIYQPYEDGAGPVYWSRLSYAADSGATWAADRANWQVVDALANYNEKDGETGLVVGDIRRCKHAATAGGDNRWKFFRWIGPGTSYAAGPFTTQATWALVPPSDDAVSLVGSINGVPATFTARRSAGEPISAWNQLTIDDDTLFGAESGGLCPVLWSAPRKFAAQGSRKLATRLVIRNTTCHSDRRFPTWDQPGATGQSAETRPAVVLATVPNYFEFVGNQLNDVLGAVGAIWDPTLDVLPDVDAFVAVGDALTGLLGTYQSPIYAISHSNTCGRAGEVHYAGGQPHDQGFIYYGPDSIPVELRCPILEQSTSTFAAVPAWYGFIPAHVGMLMRAVDPADLTEKIFRSRFDRVCRNFFDEEERKHWQIVTSANLRYDTRVGGPYQNPAVPVASVFLAPNPVPRKISRFWKFDHGRVITIYHPDANTTYTQSSNGIRLITGSSLTPAAGTAVRFLSMGGRAIQI